MLPLTTYGSEVRHLRQEAVHGPQRLSLGPSDEAPLAAEPSLHEDRLRRRRNEASEGLFVLPQGEQGHEGRLEQVRFRRLAPEGTVRLRVSVVAPLLAVPSQRPER